MLIFIICNVFLYTRNDHTCNASIMSVISSSSCLLYCVIRENTGESILYLWVEKIREFLVEKSPSAGKI